MKRVKPSSRHEIRPDRTAGVRNIIGKNDLQPAVGDYDRFPDMQPSVFVPRMPGEGREFYVKVGYSY